MATLSERIITAASARRGLRFVGDRCTSWRSWSSQLEDAARIVPALRGRGAERGSVVALAGTTSPELVTVIQAVLLTGAVPVMVPLPSRLGRLDHYMAQTAQALAPLDPRLVVVDATVAPVLASLGKLPRVELADLVADAAPVLDLGGGAGGRPDDVNVLQLTSGSTGLPKVVPFTHAGILANLDAIMQYAHVDPEADRLVSWLPLYHDMGLMSLLLTMLHGLELVLASPLDFVRSPRRWPEWISEFRGTTTAGPNFAYGAVTRPLRRSGGLDLSCLRIALNAAEPVSAQTVEAFTTAAGAHGLRPAAVTPGFGMAEATCAVTMTPLGRGPMFDHISRPALETDSVAAPASEEGPGATLRLARLGRPLAGIQVRVVQRDTGRVLGEREVGEVEVRGPSVTTGYVGPGCADRELFRDGWLRTGDMGYLVLGELVLCGRYKDVIILGGRNINAETIEHLAGVVDGVRRGNVVAFGVGNGDRRERLVVVAECDAASEVTRVRIVRQLRETVGVVPESVVLLPRGSLPKTSSGKLQRRLCRDWYLEGTLEPA